MVIIKRILWFVTIFWKHHRRKQIGTCSTNVRKDRRKKNIVRTNIPVPADTQGHTG